MKSPDGNCWRGVLDNTGILNFSQIECPGATDIQQAIKSSKSVTIFPNPADEIITIELEENVSRKLDYSIINANGQVLKKGRIVSTIQQINPASFPGGIYLLSIWDRKGNRIASEQFIIN